MILRANQHYQLTITVKAFLHLLVGLYIHYLHILYMHHPVHATFSIVGPPAEVLLELDNRKSKIQCQTTTNITYASDHSPSPSPSLLDCSKTSRGLKCQMKIEHNAQDHPSKPFDILPIDSKYCSQAMAETSPTISLQCTLQRKRKHPLVQITPHNAGTHTSKTRILPNTPGSKVVSSAALADKSFFNHVNECHHWKTTAKRNGDESTHESEVDITCHTLMQGAGDIVESTRFVLKVTMIV